MRLRRRETSRRIAAACAIALMSAACSTTASGASGTGAWPAYGLDDHNSRNQRESQISVDNVDTLAVAWRIDDLGGVTGTPAVVDGRVFFGDWLGRLWAVDAANGAQAWRTQLDDDPISASVAVGETRIYAADLLGVLYAVDKASGDVIWSSKISEDPGTGSFSSPVLVDGLVVIGVSASIGAPRDYRGSVVAVDAATGDEVWRVRTDLEQEGEGRGVAVWSSAAVDSERGVVYIGTGNTNTLPYSPYANGVLAIDYRTGELKWVYQFFEADNRDLDVGASPNLFTIDGRDVVGVGAKSGEYAVLDRDTGEQVWRVQLTKGSPIGGIMTTAAVGDGVIYVNSNDATSQASVTAALNASDGSILWQQRLPSMAFGALVLAGGVVFHGTIDGMAYGFDAADGSILWSDDTGAGVGGGFSVVDDSLFVGTGFGMPPNFPQSDDSSLIAYAVP